MHRFRGYNYLSSFIARDTQEKGGTKQAAGSSPPTTSGRVGFGRPGRGEMFPKGINVQGGCEESRVQQEMRS